MRVLPGVRLNIGKTGTLDLGRRSQGSHHRGSRQGARDGGATRGTGLSYTHVDGTHHQTAAHAPGQAQPQTVTEPLPKGNSVRGWLWIALIVAILVSVAIHLAATVAGLW
jgi:hypothetical protein